MFLATNISPEEVKMIAQAFFAYAFLLQLLRSPHCNETENIVVVVVDEIIFPC